ncbi:unnamed protein product [Camellia sinensis]
MLALISFRGGGGGGGGGVCSNPFPALETLHFWDMPEWEDWSPFEVDEEVQAFAHLSELCIQSCPNLLGKLPDSLPCLRKLEIQKCPQLVVEWLPSPIMIHHKRNTLQFSSVTSLSLSDVSILDSIPNQEVGDEVLATAACKHLSSVTDMRIENIQKLICLPRWFFHGFTGLQELRIHNCDELTTLWQNEVRLQHKLPAPALQHLEIENCPQLVSRTFKTSPLLKNLSSSIAVSSLLCQRKGCLPRFCISGSWVALNLHRFRSKGCLPRFCVWISKDVRY